MRRVYLDYAATAPLLPEARTAMQEALDAGYGNASALHSAGHAAECAIEESRAAVARLINADPTEIIFTSGGSEANNTVAEIFRDQKVAVSAIEHPSVLEPMRARAGEMQIIPVNHEGRVDPTSVPADVDLVSIMLANNELGTLEPITEIAKCCKSYNTLLHTDATQAFGKIKIDVKNLGIDYLTISAHKIGGPIGVGALYVRKGAPYQPLIIGGHQEQKRRAGTSNTVGIIGFGAAATWCWDNWSCRIFAEKVKPLRDQLRARILEGVPHSSCNSPENDCLPNILNMSFRAAEGESIQLYLDAEGIMVSTGSACAAGDIKPSHVLMATTGDAEVAHSSIRFSLGPNTTQADIDRVMQVLPGIIRRLQGISTIKISSETSAGHKTCASTPKQSRQASSNPTERSL